MTPRINQDIQERRRRLKAQYGKLYDEVAAILFRHDPVAINYETNTDEYEPEVRTILPRLQDCKSETDVTRIVFEEFDRWFGDACGAKEKYQPIAKEIWALWQKFSAKI